jgi:hypothetical protein
MTGFTDTEMTGRRFRAAAIGLCCGMLQPIQFDFRQVAAAVLGFGAVVMLTRGSLVSRLNWALQTENPPGTKPAGSIEFDQKIVAIRLQIRNRYNLTSIG